MAAANGVRSLQTSVPLACADVGAPDVRARAHAADGRHSEPVPPPDHPHDPHAQPRAAAGRHARGDLRGVRALRACVRRCVHIRISETQTLSSRRVGRGARPQYHDANRRAGQRPHHGRRAALYVGPRLQPARALTFS